jgi:hypothetical protein
MPVLFEALSARTDSLSETESSSSPSDLIEKALRKLAGRALRTAKQSLRPLKKIKTTEVNEIMLLTLVHILCPVSPTKDRECSTAVTISF